MGPMSSLTVFPRKFKGSKWWCTSQEFAKKGIRDTSHPHNHICSMWEHSFYKKIIKKFVKINVGSIQFICWSFLSHYFSLWWFLLFLLSLLMCASQEFAKKRARDTRHPLETHMPFNVGTIFSWNVVKKSVSIISFVATLWLFIFLFDDFYYCCWGF